MNQRLLIIDDTKPIHRLVTTHLQSEELEFHSAFNGETGLAMAIAVKPQLILLDIDMPDIDGFEVCRRLKASSATAGIPVIFLSSLSSTEAKVCGFELQAADYITKPFAPLELVARVRSAIRTKQLIDRLPAEAQAAVVGVDTGSDLNGATRPNPRLSFSDLLLARSNNPWNRVAPQ